MSHARIEEVSDSDIDDPDEMDIEELPAGAILAPRNIPAPGSRVAPQAPQQPSMMRPTGQQTFDKEKYKNWECLYPVYFDSNRTRSEGRRVGKELAVANPLAKDIADAVHSLAAGLNIVFEPAKLHPKDWANPGRVRVSLKERPSPKVKNKHHLYILVSEYLKAHPTTEQAAMRVQYPGMPPLKEYVPPAIPRGWKMGTLLPVISPGMSGGGVSENLFKDMMAEMGGAQPESSGEGKKKKDKKKGKA